MEKFWDKVVVYNAPGVSVFVRIESGMQFSCESEAVEGLKNEPVPVFAYIDKDGNLRDKRGDVFVRSDDTNLYHIQLMRENHLSCPTQPELEAECVGLRDDLDSIFGKDPDYIDMPGMTLRELLPQLREGHDGFIGIAYMVLASDEPLYKPAT